MPFSDQQHPPIPKAYAGVLILGVVMLPFLLSMQSSLSSFYPSDSFLRRSLSFNDITKYSTLQDVNDIDSSIEKRAKAEAGDDKCNNIFMYMPDLQSFGDHGHGSQINAYIVAALMGTYLDRNFVLLEPPNGGKYAGGSQFGCPVDAFEEIHMTSPATPSGANGWQIKENFPGGLSRLIDHPTWLSGGCPIPCADTYTYQDWARMAIKPTAMAAPITCSESDGRMVNVLVTAGGPLRKYYRTKDGGNINELISNERWATKLGATTEEARVFSMLKDHGQILDFVMGLMIKAGFLRLQPWIARDVEMLIKSVDLFERPVAKNGRYDAIHVRRGDKLIKEAAAEVQKYWRSQGHADMANLPTNYVPFAHYLSQFRKGECVLNEQGEVTERIKRLVYVATDDPVVVKQEIASLPHHIDERTILWNDCHELTFFFNPNSSDGDAFHLNGDGEYGFKDGTKDNCFMRYHRNIASVADMMILAKARTFVGEFNSNWGRLIRTMRVRLDSPILLDDGWNSLGAAKQVLQDQLPKFTKVLDTRVAWGPTLARMPGF